MSILRTKNDQEELDQQKLIKDQKEKEANRKSRKRVAITFFVFVVLAAVSVIYNWNIWITIALALLVLGCGIVMMFFGADDHIDMIVETSTAAAKASANIKRKK